MILGAIGDLIQSIRIPFSYHCGYSRDTILLQPPGPGISPPGRHEVAVATFSRSQIRVFCAAFFSPPAAAWFPSDRI